MKRVRIAAIALGVLVAGCTCSSALNPSMDISQYGHTAWTIRDGFTTGTALAMAQTPDGYFWLATEFGLFRSDGVRFVPWQPPAGQKLPEGPYALLVTRDGTLWIGTFAGLASWNNGKLTQYPVALADPHSMTFTIPLLRVLRPVSRRNIDHPHQVFTLSAALRLQGEALNRDGEVPGQVRGGKPRRKFVVPTSSPPDQFT